MSKVSRAALAALMGNTVGSPASHRSPCGTAGHVCCRRRAAEARQRTGASCCGAAAVGAPGGHRRAIAAAAGAAAACRHGCSGACVVPGPSDTVPALAFHVFAGMPDSVNVLLQDMSPPQQPHLQPPEPQPPRPPPQWRPPSQQTAAPTAAGPTQQSAPAAPSGGELQQAQATIRQLQGCAPVSLSTMRHVMKPCTTAVFMQHACGTGCNAHCRTFLCTVTV
jgi:hypothetical protein